MAELELEIARTNEDATYSVVLREFNVDSELVAEPRRGAARFDVAALRAPPASEYGRRLFDQLFASEPLRAAWSSVRERHRGEPLRVRLMIDRGAAELHRIEWERLHDPVRDRPLLLDERLLFSRFLFSNSGREPELQVRDNLRALLFISNPRSIADGTWRSDGGEALEAIDVGAETGRARAALEHMRITEITGQPGTPASLENLIAALRKEIDVLYLICHGAGQDDFADARLFLEDHAVPGEVKVVRASELAARIGSLERAPTLALLASCESAGVVGPMRAISAALSGLGPQLVEAGVMAVIAMQGKISMATAASFGSRLFVELRSHGMVDLAVAVARNACAGCLDWWMPVLFSRLRRGTIWYERGFSGRPVFDDLVGAIEAGQLTPLIGPGLMAPILGSPESFAREFAEGFLSRAPQTGWADLPRISQVRSKINSRERVHADFERLLRRRAAESVGVSVDDPRPTRDLLAEAWKSTAVRVDEPHRFLASLRLPIYITTNIDDTLTHALLAEDATIEPLVAVFRWNNRMGRDEYGERQGPIRYRSNGERIESIRHPGSPPERPTRRNPLVYHLFGHIRDPASLVLSEDDFFDYLMWCRLEAAEIPRAVEYAWHTYPLLFLGFHVDDWRFRVMFRSILNEHRRNFNDAKWKSVAASVAPEESGVVPMRRYLEMCFGGAKIETYWGPVTEFLRELAAELARRGGTPR